MSDDKKTEAIEWSRGVHRVRLEVRSYATEHGEAATPADLAAAGYVPASQLAEATAKLEAAKHDLLDIAESARSDWTSRTEASSKAMTRVSLLLDERTVLLDKLEAAEGRVRELEDAAREVLEQYGFGDRETVPIHERTAISVLAGLVPLRPAPEAAKPAETSDLAKGDTVEIIDFSERHNHKGEVTDVHHRGVSVLCGDGQVRGFDVSEVALVTPASPSSQATEHEQAAGEQPKYSRGQQVWYRWGHNAAPLLCTVKGGKRLGGYDVLGPDNVLRIAHEDNLTADPYMSEPQPPRADVPDVLTVEAWRCGFINPQNAREAYARALKALEGRCDVALATAWLCDAVRLLADELERAQKEAK